MTLRSKGTGQEVRIGNKSEILSKDHAVDEEFWAENREGLEFTEQKLDGLNSSFSFLENFQTETFTDHAIALQDNDDDEEFGGVGDESERPMLFNDDEEDEEDYGSQLVDKPVMVKANYLNYARKAKRVDVRKLKENIWSELIEEAAGQVIGRKVNAKKPRKNNDGVRAETVEKTHKFTEVITGLKERYEPTQMKDISVAFCFICLLHLANEQNLAIMPTDKDEEGGQVMSELIVEQEC